MIDFLRKNKKIFFSRVLIISFYVSVILFFLYFPQIGSLFFGSKEYINVYTFTDFITQDTVERFKETTGIKVNLKYFDTNEEFLAKFKIDGGKDYDLVTCSDFAVEILKKGDLIQPINVSKIDPFISLDKKLLGKYFDPKNEYSVPYFWSTYGIIFDKTIFSTEKVGWNLVFENPNKFLKKQNKKNYKICMLDGARESVFLALNYLFGRVENITDQDFEAAYKLLFRQRSWVDVYMFASLQYYLLGKVVPLAVTASSFAKRVLEFSDRFEFVVPKTGSLIAIDNIVIPKKSRKTEMIYKFINFILSSDEQAFNSLEFGYNPANVQAYNKLDPKFKNNNAFFPDNAFFSKLFLLHNKIDEHKIEELWLKVQVG